MTNSANLSLPVPVEPVGLRKKVRAELEESPERGWKTIRDARFLAELLWKDWGRELEEAGMDRERFLQTARGYAQEVRLWVVGERPWEHCASGLAGRARRRLGNAPGRTNLSESPLTCSGVTN